MGRKLKNAIVLKIWGKERVKIEGSVGNVSQSALFSNFGPKILQLLEIFVQNM